MRTVGWVRTTAGTDARSKVTLPATASRAGRLAPKGGPLKILYH